MTDIGAVLYASLPGLYRDKDATGDLRDFVELMAVPLEELEASIGQLREDLVIDRCRPELIGLIGSLVGVDVAPDMPLRAKREDVREAIAFYRSKGLAGPLRAFAERVTGWHVTLVDYAQRVAILPVVGALDPVKVLRDRPVGETPGGSGRFSFREDGSPQGLFDRLTGRPITRAALAADGPAYAGVEGRFTLEHRGNDLFTGAAARTVVAADLSDFANPRTPAGAALAPATGRIAVDPELGRFLIGGGGLLAGNLRATSHTLVHGSVRPQTLSLRDPEPLARIGRSDDPLPYTLDVRAPARVTDRVGHQHFDNHGLFCTPARVAASRRPNVVPPGSTVGRFTFDDRPLVLGDAAGVALQLLDGVDGSPLTRARLTGREAELAGSPSAFAIRVHDVDVAAPERRPRLRVRAADLADFANPRTSTGAALALTPLDVAVDPHLGRFVLDLAALGAAPEDVRVDYLLGPVTAVEVARAAPVVGGGSLLFTFSPDGRDARVVDAFDGTPVEMSLRLGAALGRYHGTLRGWTVRRNGADVAAALPAVATALGDPATPAPAGRLAVDVELGRFRFPPGALAAGDRISAGFATVDRDDEARIFAGLANQLPRALPAGVVGVVADTRIPPPRGIQVL